VQDWTVIVNEGPSAAASYIITSPLSVTFFGNTSTDDTAIVSYEWDFGDGQNASGLGPTISNEFHTYATAGTYMASLTVTDARNISDTFNLVVTVAEISFNQTTGAFIAPAGSVVEARFNLTVIGSNPSGNFVITVHDGSGQTGTQRISFIESWNSDASRSETGTFTMPASGIVYVYGRHTEGGVFSVSQTRFRMSTLSTPSVDVTISNGFQIQ